MSRGLLIVFEGIEGCGKSTQARLFAEWLAERRLDSVWVREPGATAVGEEIRQALLHGHELAPETEVLLFVAARSAIVRELIRPALEAGQIVVADRYELSSVAYQAYGRGLPPEQVRWLNAFATGGLKPDLTFVFDVPVSVGAGRRAHMGQAPDRIERAGAEFHGRVAQAYRLLAREEPHVELIDGTPPAAQVQQVVLERLRRRFPETFAVA